MKKTRPILISADVNSNASRFLSRDKYSVKIGIKDAERAPAITTWKIKSGTRNAAKKTPRSLDAPNNETKSLYFKIPKIWEKIVVRIIKDAAVKMFVWRETKASSPRLTMLATIVILSISC